MDTDEQKRTREINERMQKWVTGLGDEAMADEIIARDAKIERLEGQLAEFQIVAHRREWDGDESDFGNWIYAEADERDNIGIWEPVYAKVPNVPHNRLPTKRSVVGSPS